MNISRTSSNQRPDQLPVGTWQLDPRRSTVEFRARHFWGAATVKGHFDAYESRLDLSRDPAIELTIDAASVQTGNRRRDQHLRSAAFFDAEDHPRVQFISESVTPRDDTLKVRGHLSVRGHSVPLELDAKVRQVDGELEIDARTTAEHRKLGMVWSPLRTIRPRSELHVAGYLVPAADGARPSDASTT